MKLPVLEGYLTMFWFIDSFYWEGKDDDLGSLLGELSPITFRDCISADPAAWEMWNEIINKINLDDGENKYIKDDELFAAMELFLKEFAGECFKIDIIYNNIGLLKSNNFNTELSKRWEKAIEKGKENTNKYFHGLTE